MLCLTKYLFLTLHTKEEGNPSKYIILILQRSSKITATRGSETTREVFPEELPDSSASARSAQGSEGKPASKALHRLPTRNTGFFLTFSRVPLFSPSPDVHSATEIDV